MEVFKKVKIYDFVTYSSYGLVISTLLIIASFVLLGIKGFNLGIDFAGGSIVQIQYTKPAPLSKIRELLAQDERFKNSQVLGPESISLSLSLPLPPSLMLLCEIGRAHV